MIKAILFDFWNTLAYLENIDSRLENLKTLLGKKFDAYHEEFVAWHNDARTQEVFLRDLQQKLDLSDEVIASIKKEYDAPQFLYSETEMVLKTLQSKGYRLGIVSNSPSSTKERFAEFNINQYFDVVIWSFEHGVRKPDPKLFQAAIDALGVKTEETLFVGDSLEKDALAAESMGMKGVHLVREGDTAFPRSISNLREVSQYL